MIGFRVSPEFKKKLEKAAEKSKLTVSEYIYTILGDCKPIEKRTIFVEK
jgi:hypothetical protein